MKHKHEFGIILEEITRTGKRKFTLECECGKQLVEITKTGIPIK